MTKVKKRLDLTGQRFGRLVALSIDHVTDDYSVFWLCSCDCGMAKVARAGTLKNGMTKSCGCLRRELGRELGRSHYIHGLAYSVEQGVHSQMKARCGNPDHPHYRDYGGRGIKVCDRWLNGDGALSAIECFVADMGRRPSANLTIERIDNDKGYEPGNCKWATRFEQQHNKRSPERIREDRACA